MTELQLDYDDCFWENIIISWKQVRPLLMRMHIHPKVKDVIKSKSQKGWHVVLDLNIPDDPRTVMLFQAIMGSDLVRELHNYDRWTNGWEDWNRLFVDGTYPINKYLKQAKDFWREEE